MLGYPLGRAGVRTIVLEKHGAFLRDFRGDTVHPSTPRIMQELGLLREFLTLPHSELRALGAASIDVLWFRVSKQPGDPEQALGRMRKNKMLVIIDRNDYWQCAFVINTGGIDQVHAAGLEAFKASAAHIAPHVANRLGELRSFEDIKLLSVSVDRLDETWSKPGLLCSSPRAR